MIFKYKNREIKVPDDFIMKCGMEAKKRGMTLEEYIAEAFTLLRQSERPDPYDNDEYSRSHDESWDEKKAERRMDIIGQNGNDGLHYEEDWGYDANGSPIK